MWKGSQEWECKDMLYGGGEYTWYMVGREWCSGPCWSQDLNTMCEWTTWILVGGEYRKETVWCKCPRSRMCLECWRNRPVWSQWCENKEGVWDLDRWWSWCPPFLRSVLHLMGGSCPQRGPSSRGHPAVWLFWQRGWRSMSRTSKSHSEVALGPINGFGTFSFSSWH